MSDLTQEQNERLRQAMLEVIEERYKGVRTRLAEALGRSQPSMSDFLNRKSGASMETAELFSQRIMRKPVFEIIGGRRVGSVSQLAASKPHGFQVDAETEKKARILLKQPPQKFTDEAISIAKECAVFNSAEEARNPAAVAEGWRLAILGTAATLPAAKQSSPPPGKSRNSRSR